jgi:hypothetical protein
MFAAIKKIFGGAPRYQIVQSDTKAKDLPDGPKPAIVLAANVRVAGAEYEVAKALIEQLKIQRMLSPPDTAMLLITIIGPCAITDFLAHWRSLVSADQIATLWMSRMEKADVGFASASGATKSEFYSLLA